MYFQSNYTSDQDVDRDSVQLFVSTKLLKHVLSCERKCVGKSSEHTILSLDQLSSDGDNIEYHFMCSREQHNDLVDKLNSLEDSDSSQDVCP